MTFVFIISESNVLVIGGVKTPKQLKKFFKTNALTPADTKKEGDEWVTEFVVYGDYYWLQNDEYSWQAYVIILLQLQVNDTF